MAREARRDFDAARESRLLKTNAAPPRQQRGVSPTVLAPAARPEQQTRFDAKSGAAGPREILIGLQSRRHRGHYPSSEASVRTQRKNLGF